MKDILLLVLGVFITGIGLVNMMGNISTIHSYNRKNVKEEDVPAYGKTVGLGTVIIGLSLILAFIWEGFKAEIGLILGLGFI